MSDKEFYFDYQVPAYKCPRPDARITGMANSLQKAKEYLLIAMKECEAWQDSDELKQLISTYHLQ